MKVVMGDSAKNEAPTNSTPAKLGAVEVAGIVALFVVSIGIMVGFYYYPWPDGRRTTAGEFIAFYFRELLIMGAVAIGAAVAGASRVWKAVKRGAAEGGHAP